MTLIVHILNHDKPLCGFTTEAPAQWPQDHAGVDLDEVDDEMGNVNCPRCRVEAVVQALEPLHLRYDSKTRADHKWAAGRRLDSATRREVARRDIVERCRGRRHHVRRSHIGVGARLCRSHRGWFREEVHG